MEVHKHPHHVTHKKKWTEYLLEFFMLFLAVFLGFLAENIRENIVEHHREKEYIISMVNDLKTDTAKVGKNIRVFSRLLLMQDTLKQSFKMENGRFDQTFLKSFGSVMGYPDFIYTDGTIQQLKNSGGFRLIKSRAATDSIMAYDAEVKKALINEGILRTLLEKMEDAEGEIFNLPVLENQMQLSQTGKITGKEKDYILKTDPVAINKFVNRVWTYNQITFITKKDMNNVKLTAAKLIRFLNKEYHLEHE